MSSLLDLSKKLRSRSNALIHALNQRTITLARTIDSMIVKAMPVDTGRARSAVVVTIEKASANITKLAYFPGKREARKVKILVPH